MKNYNDSNKNNDKTLVLLKSGSWTVECTGASDRMLSSWELAAIASSLWSASWLIVRGHPGGRGWMCSLSRSVVNRMWCHRFCGLKVSLYSWCRLLVCVYSSVMFQIGHWVFFFLIDWFLLDFEDSFTLLKTSTLWAIFYREMCNSEILISRKNNWTQLPLNLFFF